MPVGLTGAPSKMKAAMSNDNPDERTSYHSDHLVILIHGFNTRAHWMNDVKPALQRRGFAVGATSFGDFGFARFLSFPACREVAKERILKGIRTAERIYRDDNAGNAPKKMSVIAHSFGSWLFMRILCENPGLKFHRIILCGSVLREDYDFDPVLHQFARPLLNHIGTRDYWPAIGESAGWGNGSIGSNGLNHPAAENRWHKDFHHSDFLTGDFCAKFWLPFLEGKGPEPADKWQMLPLWVRAVTFLPLRWFILSLAIVLPLSLGQFLGLKLGGVDATSHIKKFIQTGFLRPTSRECAQINPQTGLPDNALEQRPCSPGRIVFVKYLDPKDYRMAAGAPPNPKGIWPIDRPNRALQLKGTTSTGQPQWVERDLVKVDGAVEEWGQQSHYWVEVIRGIRVGDTNSGFILRRVDLQAIPVGEGKSQCDLLKGKRDVLEFAIPEDAAIRLKSGAAPNVWMR
ncbi:MAG: alpha/beta hydrolase, partial [Methylocella sp.]